VRARFKFEVDSAWMLLGPVECIKDDFDEICPFKFAREISVLELTLR